MHDGARGVVLARMLETNALVQGGRVPHSASTHCIDRQRHPLKGVNLAGGGAVRALRQAVDPRLGVKGVRLRGVQSRCVTRTKCSDENTFHLASEDRMKRRDILISSTAALVSGSALVNSGSALAIGTLEL